MSTSAVQEVEAHWFIWDQYSAADAFQLPHLWVWFDFKVPH